MPTETKIAPVPVDPAIALEKFQEAARKVMQRIYTDDKLRYLMAGTECYDQIIRAYAYSMGKTLPDSASMLPVAKVWEVIHS